MFIVLRNTSESVLFHENRLRKFVYSGTELDYLEIKEKCFLEGVISETLLIEVFSFLEFKKKIKSWITFNKNYFFNVITN